MICAARGGSRCILDDWLQAEREVDASAQQADGGMLPGNGVSMTSTIGKSLDQ